MDKGEIIEEGSHNELMVQQGAYYRFFQLQSRL
jgi:ABC-type multidrug transport system fused ATPase/permease subunit